MSNAKTPLHSEKWQADDGREWCKIWYAKSEDVETDRCFEFPFRDLDLLIASLLALKKSVSPGARP